MCVFVPLTLKPLKRMLRYFREENTIDLTAEHKQLAKIVRDFGCRFPSTDNGDAQLLQDCYDCMETFIIVMDGAFPARIDYICQPYEGDFRIAKRMEMSANGISEGVIEVSNNIKNNMPGISA